MSFTVDPTLLFGFVIALVRASAWLVVVPPLSSRSIPAQVKAGLAVSLAVAASDSARTTAPGSFGAMLGVLLLQVVVGVSLGFMASMLLSAISSAGALIGITGGFNTPPALDPLHLEADNVVANMFSLVTQTLLIVGGGFLALTRGFLLSFDAVPTHGIIGSSTALSSMVLHGFTQLFLAATQIAAPVAAVMLLVQVVVGIAGKASPALNVLGLAIPIQNLLTLGLIGALIVLLPNILDNLVGQSLVGMHDVAGVV